MQALGGGWSLRGRDLRVEVLGRGVTKGAKWSSAMPAFANALAVIEQEPTGTDEIFRPDVNVRIL